MNSWIEVTLTEIEMEHAALVGIRRHFNAMTHNYKDRSGAADPFEQLEHNLNGAAGEAAVAKLFNKYWGGHLDRFKGPDLGKAVQVRTRSEHWHDLLVQPDDKDDEAFMLVTGVAPFFRVHGWMWGRDAKQPQWLQTYGGKKPAYFPPKEELKDIRKALKEIAEREREVLPA